MFKKHGDHLTRLYGLWRNFRYRCNCPTSKDYKHYGGRGIQYDKAWDDYIVFKDWAIKHGYMEGLTIERKNTNGPYSPNNCYFTTVAENNKNKTTGYWWVLSGIKFKSQTDAAEHFNVGVTTIRRWCGVELSHGKYTKKHGCFRVKKYD